MSQGKILLISDSDHVNKSVTEALRPRNFEIVSVYDAQSGLNYLDGEFDLVLLKYGLTGCDVKSLLKQVQLKDHLAMVLLLVEQKDVGVMEVPISGGVLDVITFPFNIERFALTVSFAVKLRQSQVSNKKIVLSLEERNASLQKQNILLAKRIEESAKSLNQLYDSLRFTYMRTIKALIEAIETKDHYTRNHSERVTRYAVFIAQELGLQVKEIEVLRDACSLHDIGKIGIEDRILNKEGPLMEEEWEHVKLHPVKGAQILEPLTFLEDVILIVRQHHERYDGTGYPDKLKGEEISLGARIVSVVDAYEAMTSARSYRMQPLSKEEAVAEIRRQSGKQFDSKVVEVFLKVVDRF